MSPLTEGVSTSPSLWETEDSDSVFSGTVKTTHRLCRRDVLRLVGLWCHDLVGARLWSTREGRDDWTVSGPVHCFR